MNRIHVHHHTCTVSVVKVCVLSDFVLCWPLCFCYFSHHHDYHCCTIDYTKVAGKAFPPVKLKPNQTSQGYLTLHPTNLLCCFYSVRTVAWVTCMCLAWHDSATLQSQAAREAAKDVNGSVLKRKVRNMCLRTIVQVNIWVAFLVGLRF